MKERITILHADDDADDRQLFNDAVKVIDPAIKIFSVVNGKQALDFLSNNTENELPDLIVLDYNMPLYSGAEVLVEISQKPKWKKIPTFILSTSNRPLYNEECLRYGAKGYFAKPSNMEELIELVRQILFMSVAILS